MPPVDIPRISQVAVAQPATVIDVSSSAVRPPSVPVDPPHFLPVLCIPLALGANPFVQSAGAWLAAKGYQLAGKPERAAEVAFARGEALSKAGQDVDAYQWYVRARSFAPLVSMLHRSAGDAAYDIAMRNAATAVAALHSAGMLGHYQGAHQWYMRAADVAGTLDEKAAAYEAIARMLYPSDGQDRATILDDRRDALDPRIVENYHMREAQALESAAAVRSARGHFTVAAEHYARAAAIRDAWGDAPRARQALIGRADAFIAQAGQCEDVEMRGELCVRATEIYADVARRIAAAPLEHEQAEMMMHQAERWESIGEWARAAQLYVTLTYAAEGARHTRATIVERYAVARLRELDIPVGARPSGDIVQTFAQAFTVVSPDRSSSVLTTALFTKLLKEAERCAQYLSDTLRDAAAAELWALVAANALNSKARGEAWRSCLSRIQAAAQTETPNHPETAHALYQKAVHVAGQLDDAAMVQQMYLAMARTSIRVGRVERAVQEMDAARQALPSAMVLASSYHEAANYLYQEAGLRAHGADAPAPSDYVIAAYFAYALLLVYRARTLSTDSPRNFERCQQAWERFGKYLEETRRYPAALAAYRQARQLAWREGQKKVAQRIDGVIRIVQTMMGSRHGRVLPESALRAVFRGIDGFPIAELMAVPVPMDKDGRPVRLSVATDAEDK